MDLIGQWKEICEDTDLILSNIASDGMTDTNSNNIQEAEDEIAQILSSLPSYILQFQQKPDSTKCEINDYLSKITQMRLQAELILTIFSELNHETSAIKMNNMICTWNLRDSLF